jgi:hypothetical protein
VGLATLIGGFIDLGSLFILLDRLDIQIYFILPRVIKTESSYNQRIIT